MQKFLIENNDNVDHVDLENLRLFYSPILGIKAISFYQYLFDLFSINHHQDTFDLQDTQEFLSFDNSNVIEAREMLEALGLLKSYKTNDGMLLFELKKPLSANNIVKNKIIANLLIKKIGQKRFDELINKKANFHFNKNSMLEISKKYHEVFDLDNYVHNEVQTYDFELSDQSVAKKQLKSEEYISYILKKEPSPSQLLMIKHLTKLGFQDHQINLFINYSMNINKCIVVKYIEKIAKDYANKKLFEADEIDKELQMAYMSKAKNDFIFSHYSHYNNSQNIEKTSEFMLDLANEDNWDN
ncbi:DnaD domain protein [[Mycoplasma] anseris]|uniref:Uncharacterized protein n=1 Tax=[Mycoplasma] anseris TaxID=92400 RepID=A0A2Z4NDA9_9BACT|nr:DnaD domain protein [[Mycoplasma] anseris]AWX69539.1 hypothetical protein DP065_02120 [[Mycoplasma] anseris]